MSRTAPILAELHRYESRNITFQEPDGSWPIVWARAGGVNVWDVEGKKYLDLTAAFGVAAAGHANRRVVNAGRKQMSLLLHAMGDVHPHPLKARLVRELSRVTFERWSRTAAAVSRVAGKTILCNSGFEAVEAALKTALLATGKPGVVAFSGAYHGLGYGALNATHRLLFRGPFRSQLGEFGHFAAFPTSAGQAARTVKQVEARFRRGDIGATIIEPVQGRGGIRVVAPGFLPALRRLCDQHQVLFIADEIFTGFGRTGAWFACEHSSTVPDLICLGKGLTGGFPLSACVGRAGLMDRAWPDATGEALHTSTYLGHPVGCAMALAQIDEIRRRGLVARSARLGTVLQRVLRQELADCPRRNLRVSVRGRGLMAGIELTDRHGRPATELALACLKRLLHAGYILLPEGEHSNVLSLTPPLVITEASLRRAVKAMARALSACTRPAPLA